MSEDQSAGASARAEHERRLARHRADVRRRRPEILVTAAAVAIFGLINAHDHPIA
jgi:hypothetical protein